ncbi:MAG: glycosyltransferase family 4 protein [Clostridia bacterium]
MKVAVEIQPILKEKSGVGWYNYNLIKEFVKADFDFTGQGFNFVGRNNISGILREIGTYAEICKFIPYGLYYRVWDYLPMKYNRLFKTQADIYHFFNFIVPPRIEGKVITTIYDMVYKRYPDTMTKANYRRLDKNIKRSVKRADIVVTISENSKQEIIEYLGVQEEKIRIVSPGVDLEVYSCKYGVEELTRIKDKYKLPDKYALYLGTLEPRKSIDSIIEGYAQYKLLNKDTNLKLVIAGKKGWMYDSIFESLIANKLVEDVIFTGYVEEEDKPFIYKLSSMFIFPSLYEGFGMPVLEAMAAGVPVITSNSSSLPEVVGDAGLLVEPKDIQAIADYIGRLDNDSDLRNELITRGLERSKLFTWEKSARRLIQIYKELGAE